LNFSLISNKNLSQYILSRGWRPEHSNLGQNGLKPTPRMT